MRLLNVRKFAVKQQSRVRFQLSSGMECLITEHGLLQVPELRRPPDFNLEEEFARASRFVIEPGGSREKVKSQTVSREELEALVAAGAAGKTPEEREE